MTIKECLIEEHKANGGISRKDLKALVVAKMKCSPDSVEYQIGKLNIFERSGKPRTAASDLVLKHAVGVTMIVQEFDVVQKVHDGLKSLKQGHVIYDEDFRRDLGISTQKWAGIRDLQEFDKFRFSLPTRKIVWGNPADLLRVKEVCERV